MFGTAESLTVPAPPAGEGQPDQLALGLPATGPALALWHEVGGVPGDVLKVTSSVVKASVRPPSGAFAPATQVSTAGALAGQPQAAALTDRAIAAWNESTRARGVRVCIIVRAKRTSGSESRCLRATNVDSNTIDVAAGRTYGLVSWIRCSTDPGGGGRLYLATYRR